MRAQSYEKRRIYQQGKAQSHFLGLQCVLDKYQHQNQILCQKVASLIQQNKRLRTESIFKPTKQIIRPTLDMANLRDTKYEFKRYQQPTQFKSRHNKQELYQSYGRKNYDFKSSALKKYKPELIEEDVTKTQRKYSYISKAQDLIERRRNNYVNINERIDAINSSSCYPNEGNQTQRISWRQRLKTEPTKNQPSPPKAQQFRKNKQKIKFTKQAYLLEETIIQDQTSSQKSPTFIQASFGNQQSKQQSKNLQTKTINNYDLTNKSQKKGQVKTNLEKSFKLERRENEKQQKYVFTQKILLQKNVQKFNNQIVEPAQMKKTNLPYTQTDYKISQPKTQLAKLLHKEKQEQQNKPMIPNKSIQKKSFLSIMSKTLKTNIFR